MLALIQREVVDRQGWIDEEEFLNMIALAQAAPGLIAVNSAIFIGWRVGGWKGVVGAVLGAGREIYIAGREIYIASPAI